LQVGVRAAGRPVSSPQTGAGDPPQKERITKDSLRQERRSVATLEPDGSVIVVNEQSHFPAIPILRVPGRGVLVSGGEAPHRRRERRLNVTHPRAAL
jgi:hypothetical protein